MSTPLLATKLHIPPIRPESVPRPRLIERLNEGLDRRLTLVSAPAGFGKTTLLGEFVTGCDRPVGWLSLDQGDDDPVHFLRYLVAALQTIDQGIGQGALSLLRAPQLSPGQGLVTHLLNDISVVPAPFVLVLDDYQATRRIEVQEMVGFLIDNQPPQMHTLIGTRRDPRLPLARWRVRGELSEIRVPDLRFTADEANIFLNERMGLELAAELVEVLGARTEGWIAGLQLAALALQGQRARSGDHDPAAFVGQFSGTDRYVIDYLVDEVLQQQPAHLRRFLQQTAVLEELSASLCDSVRAGSVETEAGKEDSANILQEVERANLFLVPLDNRREWYRYHHLFAEVLVATLAEEEAQTLHRRAARWYQARGRVSRAIHHALAGRDLESAVQLMKVAAPDRLQQGSFARVLSWLDAIPDGVVRSDPELATYKGYSLLWTGDRDAAESYADSAEKSLSEGAPAATRGRFLTLRAHLYAAEVVPLATEAVKLLDERSPFFYGAALLLLALGHKRKGHVAEMMDAFRVLARLEEGHNPFMAAVATGEMAEVLRLQGRRREALAVCQQAIEQHLDSRGRSLPSLIVVLLIDAMLAYEANDLPLALQKSEQCATMAQQTGMSFLAAQCRCYVDLPSHWALAERAQAWAALREAHNLTADDHPLYPEASIDTGSCEAWLHLKDGDIGAAARWAATYGLPAGSLTYEMSHVYLTYVRVLLAQNSVEEATQALRRLEGWARDGGWKRVLLSTTLLRAISAAKGGDEASAFELLAQALDLAAAEDYRRAFLDEDPVVFELLPRLRAHPGEPNVAEFVERLLVDWTTERQRASPDAAVQRSDVRGTLEEDASPPSTVAGRPPPGMPESLTERELDVLRLLAEGLTTPDIADRLYISAGTAKWHTINIYRKLDVHGRVQAVARARELGLI